MKKNYVVWDSASGAYDGAYVSLNSAKDSLNLMKKLHPSKCWCIVQIIKEPESNYLADDTFHSYMLWTETVDKETGEKYSYKFN